MESFTAREDALIEVAISAALKQSERLRLAAISAKQNGISSKLINEIIGLATSGLAEEVNSLEQMENPTCCR